MRELLARRAIGHLRTALEYALSEARRASLPHWMCHDYERRTHSPRQTECPFRVREVTGLSIQPVARGLVDEEPRAVFGATEQATMMVKLTSITEQDCSCYLRWRARCKRRCAPAGKAPECRGQCQPLRR